MIRDGSEYDMKNYADPRGYYPPKPKAEVDDTLQDSHNSSYHAKPEFNNICFVIHSKYFRAPKTQNAFKWVLPST